MPVFAKLNGLDLTKVKVEYIDPALRESLCAKGRVDVITGQLFLSVIDLRAKGVKDEDIGSFI